MKTDIGLFRVAVGAIILNEHNHVLLTKRSAMKDHNPNTWEIPSGRLDTGESPEQALRREMKEELNIKIAIIAPIQTYHFYRGEAKQEHVVIDFLCRYESGDIQLEEEEVSEYAWMSLEEAVKRFSIQDDKHAIEAAKRYLLATNLTL